jgi:hypothetical protein
MIEFAKRELKHLLDSKEEYDNRMAENVLELLNVFANQGHSGFSAPWCVQLFSRLAMYKPLGPLTGEDDEWQKIDNNLFQNKRYSAVFKKGKDGKAYNVEARVFSDDGGKTWFGNKNSWEYIDFPYTVPNEPEKVILNKEKRNETMA